MVEGLAERGWSVFPYDTRLMPWVKAARAASDSALSDPDLAHWYVCEDTWFVGVDALKNSDDGTLKGTRLTGAVIDHLNPMPKLHRAQLSVVWPGYPKPREGETEAAFLYRKHKDAAHVDGVRAVGTPKRRFLKEPHAFILGIPLNEVPDNAAPLTVWDGSHHIMRRAFQSAFQNHPPETWPDIDITDIYVAARKEVFDTCQRIEVPAQPGQATLTHRLTLHGVAPWSAAPDGDRRIAYFRPELERNEDWLTAP